MIFGAPGLIAMLPTPRPAKADWPSGPVQVSPPSVDLKIPTPWTQPLPQVFASPVPTYSVLPVASFGSSVIEPMALIPNPPERYVHFTVFASASSVRQTPPPASATQSLQFLEMQVDPMAMALIRLAAAYSFGT